MAMTSAAAAPSQRPQPAGVLGIASTRAFGRGSAATLAFSDGHTSRPRLAAVQGERGRADGPQVGDEGPARVAHFQMPLGRPLRRGVETPVDEVDEDH